jgi:uncharacterized protein (UPF0276 family)
MTPKALLTQELNSYKKALKKSRLSVFTQKISYKTHKNHYNNLMPLIKQYKEVIRKL